MFKKFWKNKSGNFAITFAICAAPLFGMTALAVDYVTIFQKRSELQEAADMAALSAAREMAIASTKSDEIQSIAAAYANANVNLQDATQLTVNASPSTDKKTVSVRLSYNWTPFFAHYFDSSALPINVEARASLAGSQASVCVLALDDSDPQTIYMNKKSSMTANGCVVYSNSSSKNGISIDAMAYLTATDIMSAGGYDNWSKNYRPQPVTDVPPIPDPLEGRSAPSVGSCDHQNFSIQDDVTLYLDPGVYCGGLDIGGKANVILRSGEYVITERPLSVRAEASLKGNHVGIYMTGSNATFDFAPATTVSLTAPKTGDMAGILFFEDRNSSPDRVFTIRSKNAEKFEGVIYLPKGTLWVDKESRVGQISKWTAIIAKKVSIGMGPKLQINSDYSNSEVPVPEGIAGENAQVRLIK